MTNWNVPHDSVLDDSGLDASRHKWVLLESVALAILLSVGLTAIGGLVGGLVYSNGSSTITNSTIWLAVEFGSRWVTPPIAGLLLAELAVCWLSYGQWAGPAQDAPASMIRIHIRRVHRLITWTQISSAAVLVAALASGLSLIVVDHSQNIGIPTGQLWGADLYGIFNALGVVLLMVVGTYAANRLQGATRRYLAEAASATN